MFGKIRSIKSKDLMLFSLLVLGLSPFTNRGTLYIIIGFVFSMAVSLITPFQRLFDKSARTVLIFSFSYAAIGYIFGQLNNLPFALFIGIVPPFFYVYGRYLAIKLRDVRLLSDFFWVVAVALASFIFWMVLTGKQFIVGGIADERALLDSSGEAIMAATSVGTLVSVGLVGFFVAMSCKQLNLIRKVGWVGLFLLSLYVVTFFINRAGVYIVMICGALFLFVESKSKKSSNIFISLVIFALMALLVLNMGFLSDQLVFLYEERNSESNDRWRRWAEAFSYLLTHPLGFTGVMRYYVHNMWLDVARQAGWIPFISLLLLTIRGVKSLIKLLKKKTDEMSKLMSYIFICMTLSCAVEPLIESIPLYFMVYILVIGMVNQYSNNTPN